MESWIRLEIYVFGSRRTQLASMSVCMALLAGCAAGPDFTRPVVPASPAYAPASAPLATMTVSASAPQGASQRFKPAGDIPRDWWRLFQSSQLNSLIERAFRANPNIAAAKASLLRAQEYTNAQRGFFYPSLAGSYDATRNKVAGNLGGSSPGVQGNGQVIQTYSNPAGPAPYNGPAYYSFHTAQLSVGYVPDVFGLNRRMVESLQAQEAAQYFELQAAYLTLASNVVAAALQEASLRAQIKAVEQIIAANRKNLAIMKKQLQLGYVSGLDIASQQAVSAQSEQVLITLKMQLEKTRDLIRMLAGNPPDMDVPETFDLDSLHLPEELPLSLPSRLVEQRPDIRMAEEQLHSASAQYGVAIANTLPQFSVTATMGGAATTPGWMFRSGGGFFSLAANVAYVIYEGGALSAQSRAAQHALEQAAAQYRATVIAALQNVADTLYTIQFDAEMLRAASDAAHALEMTRDLTRKQYEAGEVSFQTVLLAEQNYLQSQVALIQAQTNRLGDSAALYQALGGGWWNHPGMGGEIAGSATQTRVMGGSGQ